MARAAADRSRLMDWRVVVSLSAVLVWLSPDQAAADTRMDVPPNFDRVTFAEDGSGAAMIYQAKPGADSVLLVQDAAADFQRIELNDEDPKAPTVVVATGLPQPRFVVLRPSDDMTRLFAINTEEGIATPVLRIPAHRTAFSHVTRTGQLFSFDKDRSNTGLQVIDLCAEFGVASCTSGTSSFNYGKVAPFFDLAVDSFAVDPFSDLLVAVDRRENALVAWDLQLGEIVWGEPLSRPTRQLVQTAFPSVGPTWIEPQFSQDGAQFLAGPYEQIAAALYEINRDFRDWRQISRIDRRDLSSVAPIVKTLDIPPPAEHLTAEISNRFVTRAIAATDDRLVVKSEDQTILHSFLVNQSAFVRHADIDFGDAVLLDFDLSRDGRVLALLFDQQLVRLDWSELDQSQTAASGYDPAIATVQQKLIEWGFHQGVADGQWSFGTQAALLRYFETSGVGGIGDADRFKEELQAGNQDALLKFLGDSLDMELLLSAGMDQEAAMSLYRRAVRAFAVENLPNSDPSFVLQLFTPPAEGSDFAECAGDYSPPPKVLWRNVIGVADAVEAAASRLDADLPILSGYQPSPMLDCTGLDGILADQFSAFAAIEVARTDSTASEDLQATLPGAYTVRVGNRTAFVFNDGFRGFLLANTQVIRNVSSRADDAIANYLFSDDAIDLMIAAGIDTRLRYAHFMAQVMTETGGLRTLEENLNYSADALLRVFSRRTISPAMADEIARDPHAIANLIYGGKLGNGPPSSDDGWNYRARGFFQFTGRSDYERLSKETGIDFAGEPDLMADPPFALRAALLYWTSRNINAAADANDHLAVRKLVNGPAAHGYDQSRAWFNRIWIQMEQDASK